MRYYELVAQVKKDYGVELKNCIKNAKKLIPQLWEDSRYCKIVAIVKCDPSTQWWSTFWNYGSWVECGCEAGCSDCEATNTIYYRGPKPGCEVIFFPKRIQFDPAADPVASGNIWKVGNKWVQKCRDCYLCLPGKVMLNSELLKPSCDRQYINCSLCKGKGYKELSGPSFSSALIIMDRRGI
jgi:hypothetical protein